MSSPTIKTSNYTLRPFIKEDALLWQNWDIDSEIQAHMPEPKNEVQDIANQYEYIKEYEEDEEGYYWTIEAEDNTTKENSIGNKHTVTAIGTVSLFEINSHHKNAQLGILIGDKSYWGKGVATEVIRELVTYAFTELGISYIGAEVEEGNIPMKRVFEKAGFEQDGFFKGQRVKDGKRVNVVHFGIVNLH
jgi:RimJ/RimL family protein N-acetyltransferase